MRCSISARSAGKGACNRTSFGRPVNSYSDASQERLSDSDKSSCYSSARSRGIEMEKSPLADSESDWRTSERLFREGYFSEQISLEIGLEFPDVERKITEENETKSKSEVAKNDISDSVLEEPQPTSNFAQGQPRESLSDKRSLSSSPSCAEEESELKSTPKTRKIKRRKKKKKKKGGSIIKRLFQRFK